MKTSYSSKGQPHSLTFVLSAAITVALLASPSGAQNETSPASPPGGNSNTASRHATTPPAGVNHARRETVKAREADPSAQRRQPPVPAGPQRTGPSRTEPSRTGPPRTVPAPQTGGQKPGGGREQPTWTGPPQRPNDRTQADNQARRIFTRSREGRRYDNGVRLRPGTIVQDTWHRLYFRRGRLHYPYYSPTYSPVTVVISPFAFYFGVCAPFIFRNHTYHAPPVSVFIEIPVYQGVYYRGYEPIQEQANLLDRDYLSSREPGLANALDELRETFLRKDIDALVTLVDPKVRIAVFLKGTYEYSLDPDDYLDMTRDSIRETETIGFTITRLHQRGVGVYVASGEHVYRDRDGRARRVFVSYVLENIRGIWTLTQVGTAPDRIQEW